MSTNQTQNKNKKAVNPTGENKTFANTLSQIWSKL